MKVSVIIPVYNVLPALRGCLMSISAQTEKDWECICVDDGSTDGSDKVLDDFAVRDLRFRVCHQPNAGVSAARNRGLQMAKGEIVCFADADDFVEPDWLENYVRAFASSIADVVRLPSEDPWPLDGFPWKYAVKREIALRTEFPVGVAMSEDSIYVARLQPYVRHVVKLNRMTYRHLEYEGSAMRRSLTSAERLVFLQTLAKLVEEQPSIDHLVVSRLCAEGILCWLGRPKETRFAHEIRGVWRGLARVKCAQISAAKPVLRFPYMLYVITGWLFPTRICLAVLSSLVKVKRVLT